MPLKAILDENPFYGWDLTERDRGKDFKCPHCDDRLIPVIPTSHIIKHFRHKNNEAHGEPETPEHLAGKQYILDLANKFGMTAEPEEKVGWHICDVLVKCDGMKIPVEFQCSPISLDKLLDRARSYDTVHYWILGGHYYRNATNFREWKNGQYHIQRIRKIEKRLMIVQPLLYLNWGAFYLANWKYRFNASVLGWYNLKRVPDSILEKLLCRGLT